MPRHRSVSRRVSDPKIVMSAGVIAAGLALATPPARVQGARVSAATACSLVVERTDTLRLADGRGVFLSAEMADTAMGMTLIAGSGVALLPARGEWHDSASFMERANRQPVALGFVVNGDGIARALPSMPDLVRPRVARLASAGREGWHVIIADRFHDGGTSGDDSIRLRYARWDGSAWRDVQEMGIDHGQKYLIQGRRLLVSAGDTLAFVNVREDRQWTRDVVIWRRVGRGPWTSEVFLPPYGAGYADYYWDSNGRPYLLYLYPDVEREGRDRGTLFRMAREGNAWGPPVRVYRGGLESIADPRFIERNGRQVIVWEGELPTDGQPMLAVRSIRSDDGGRTWSATPTSLLIGSYFIEMSRSTSDGGGLVVTRLGEEQRVALVDPFAESDAVVLRRPASMIVRPTVAPAPDRRSHLFRTDTLLAEGQPFPYVALRDVLLRRCD